MKRNLTWMLAACLGLAINYPVQGQNAVGGASGAASGATRAATRAAVRVPTRANTNAATRTSTQAGANFNAANLRVNTAAGANANQRTSIGTNGLRAGASARSEMNADIRMRQDRHASQETRPSNGTGTQGQADASLLGGLNASDFARSGFEARFNQRVAELNRMRDAAVLRGDIAMLQRADELELRLRAEHEQQTRMNAEFEASAVGAASAANGRIQAYGNALRNDVRAQSQAAGQTAANYQQRFGQQARTQGRAMAEQSAEADIRGQVDTYSLSGDLRTRYQSAGEFGSRTPQDAVANGNANARIAAQTASRFAIRGQEAGQAVAADLQARGYGVVNDASRTRVGSLPINVRAAQQANVNGSAGLRVAPLRAAVDQSADINNRFRFSQPRRTPAPQDPPTESSDSERTSNPESQQETAPNSASPESEDAPRES